MEKSEKIEYAKDKRERKGELDRKERCKGEKQRKEREIKRK